MTLEDAIRIAIDGIMQRCDSARAAGGIALRDAEDGKTIPDGWVLDWITSYYVPPNLFLDELNTKH